MTHKVILSKHAERDLAGLPVVMANEVVVALRALAARQLANADIKKLHGRNPPEYRIRLGNYRVLFRWTEGDVFVLRIADRKDAYR